MLVGGCAGTVAARIDGIEFGAIAARLHDKRPEMHVGAEDIGAPGQDQAGMAELFGLGAETNAEGFGKAGATG